MKTRGHVLLGIKKKARILGCLVALTGVGLWGTKFVYAMPQGGVIAEEMAVFPFQPAGTQYFY